MLEFSVSGINNYIKRIITSDINLKSVQLEGEVCPFKEPSRGGHLYFELKDEDARIKCVLFNAVKQYAELPFKEGDHIILEGRIDLYEKAGTYQFIVSSVKVEGLGELYIKFLELKEKLDKEGLFEKTKRTLPERPNIVGIITSPTGAAINDFCAVIRRRFPTMELILYPVHVQGVETINEVCSAIDYFNKIEVDLVVLTRGGGSYEELAVFNNEKIARKLSESIHPTVSAIGHEPDYLITDFVADLRAATPTAAAELISPDLFAEFEQLNYDLTNSLYKINNAIVYAGDELDNYKRMLEYLSPFKKYNRLRDELNLIYNKISSEIFRIVSNEKLSLIRLYKKIMPFDKDAILSKGYTITIGEDGRPISISNLVKEGKLLKTVYEGGKVISIIKDVKE